MRVITGLALLFAVGCANTDIASMASAPDPARRLQESLDRAVALRPGRSGVLLVDVPGELHFEGASGLSDPHTGRAARPDDRFRTASITKMVTAALVLKLAEEGRIDLDGNLLPYFPAELVDRLSVGLLFRATDRTSRGRAITVRHLLGHTSGLWDYYTVEQPPNPNDGVGDIIQEIIADPRRHWEPLELVERAIRWRPPLTEPGQSYYYGDTNYVLAGLVVESVSGMPLPRVYRERVLSPLGMGDTYLQWYEPEAAGAPLAHVYMNVFAREYEVAPFVDTASWAGSGLVSSAGDLSRFGRALFDGRFFDNPATWPEMHRWSTQSRGAYGLGLMRVFPSGAELWGHTGQWGSFLYYWPQRRAILCGTLNDSLADVDALLGEIVHIVEEER